MWQAEHLVALAAEVLQRHAEALDLEQAVRGLDALAESDVHRILTAGFQREGLGVHNEWPYPGGSRRARARERCDLVLTAGPGRLADPVAERRARQAAAGTLFAETLAQPPEGTYGPEEAFWMEVKVIGQFCVSAGVASANRTYAAELLSGPLADIRKLAADPGIRHAGLLLVHYAAERDIADHDLAALVRRCTERGVPAGCPALSRFPIADRIGNTLATAVLIPVRRHAEPETPGEIAPVHPWRGA